MNRLGFRILFLCLLFSLRTSGQEHLSLEAGLPLIQNFPPQVYLGAAQNWDIVQDRLGMIYVANAEGILQYDGQGWRAIPAPHGSWVYALGIDTTGAVYFGGEETFGYLAPDSSGTFKTISLVSEVPQADAEFGRIRNILTTSEGIFFQSFSRLFRWSDHRMQIWKSRTAFLASFFVNDEVYVLKDKVGLMKMGDDHPELLSEGEKFAEEPVSGILPYRNEIRDGKGTILIATPTNGLFLYDQNFLNPFHTEIDRYLKEARIQSAALIAGDLYAFGTLKNGIFIIDRQGRFLAHLNKRSGLLSDDVKSIKTDWEGRLWLVLQTGVSRVDFPSPLSFFDRQLELAGSVGSIMRHQNALYVASSQGVLYLDDQPGKPISRSDKVPSNSGFLPVSGVSASCWNLLEANRTLLAATEEGIYQIAGSEASFLPDPSGEKLFCFSLYHSRSDTNQVFAGIRNRISPSVFNNNSE